MKPAELLRVAKLPLAIGLAALAGPAARCAAVGAVQLWLSGWRSGEGWLHLLAGLAASVALGFSSGRLTEDGGWMARLLVHLTAAASVAAAISTLQGSLPSPRPLPLS